MTIGIDEEIKAVDILNLAPTGVIFPFAGSSVPSSDWLICDGSAVSRTTYSGLFSIIGTTYGVGDGSTTFNLPDLRDKFPIGKSGTKTLGSQGGSSTKTLSTNNIPSHSHTGTSDAGSAHSHGLSDSVTGAGSLIALASGTKAAPTPVNKTTVSVSDNESSHTHSFTTSNTGSGDAFDVLNPYLAINWIIRI